MKGMMKVSGMLLLSIFVLGVGGAVTMAQTSSQEETPAIQVSAAAGQSAGESAGSNKTTPPSKGPYSGDLWHRSTLTGDWGGSRNDLAAKGVTFDMSLTQVGQGAIDGGKDEGWAYGGRGNLTINVDTQKLGLWPGGFLTVEVEGNYANSVNNKTGALMPVNNNALYPMPYVPGHNDGDNLNVPAVAFMQFFSPYAGIVLGKLDTTSGDANEFAHGKGDEQFFNLALSFNPVYLLTAPYSTLGAGVILLPTKDPKASTVTFSVLQSNGKASTSGFSDLHWNQLTFAGEARVRTNFFGLTGHQLIGGMYSNRDFSSLDQSLRFIVENRSIQEKSGSWNIYYNFDQYFYEPKKGSGEGVGIFGRFGVSDGNPNPMHYFFSLGMGGKGVIPSRPLDSFGIGGYYIDVTNPKFTGPLTTTSVLRDEYGVEAYYNIAITPWMKLTPDMQVIRPSQKEVGTMGRNQFGLPVINRKSVDAATVVGLRLQLVF
jgi:porin